MELSKEFKKNILATYPKTGRAWLEDLPNQIHELCRIWGCQFVSPMPHLSYHFVGRCEYLISEGSLQKRFAVLKMAPPEASVSLEMAWLNFYHQVTPKVLNMNSEMNAFLMEEMTPGFTLKQTMNSLTDDEATQILCGMIKRLNLSPTKDLRFKHLSEFISDLDSLNMFSESYLLSKAKSLFKDLTHDRTYDVLLHGDLHHDNIIRHGEEWNIIDPHGFLGDPASEVGVFIFNPLDSFPKHQSLAAVLRSRLDLISEILPYDSKKMKAWAFCRTMLSAAWFAQDFQSLAKDQLEIAREIENSYLS